MSTTSDTPPADATASSDLERAIADLANGVRDPEAMREAAERMDRRREEARRRTGDVEVAVALVRELRDAR